MALSAQLRTFSPKTAVGVGVGPPYDVQAAEIFVAGAVRGEAFLAGAVAGDTFTAGAVVGDVDT